MAAPCSESAVSSSEPPEPSSSGEDGRSRPSEEPPPPPPPRAAVGEQPPPPLPPDVARAREDAAPGRDDVGPARGDSGPARGGGASPTRRRRLILGVVAAVLVVAVPVGLALVSGRSGEEPTATDTADEPASPGDDGPEPPDPDTLSGRDAVLAQLLAHIDESERAMVAFQDRLEAVLRQGDGEPRERVAEVGDAAEEGAAALEEARSGLAQPLDDGRVDEVRSAYLAHHDAWADYLDALAEDPTLLGMEAERSRWQLAINLSAEVFAQELRAILDADLASSVRSYANDLLQRGFERPDAVPDA